MKIPKVFISYSHDTYEHKMWVLELATRLRNHGVDAIIDLWELQPGDDLPLFMEKNLRESDRVIMICTERYVEKANIGIGGVGYEKMIITSNLLSNIDSNKVIPIIRQKEAKNVPTFIKSKMFIDLSYIDGFEVNFDNLLRSIHQAPLFEKPPVGNNPYEYKKNDVKEKVDSLKEVMQIIVKEYEELGENIDFDVILNRMDISRILLEVILEKAQEEGLIRVYYDNRDGCTFIELRTKGKTYALEQKLVINNLDI